ncbi:two-component system QseEF-associated lipoprotein QseG [Mixta theicola]|uniref:Two-component system QseEF-associated lipoprotein QseG n=1 Tax=Mixta theicola TaxID=1458355 RepID=A0A2K1Q8Q5_9GAMM|nr:two-component system QseEF-associated lipoprotein QseG [Mixta theicola]PNS11408.1 two-component system QseEF-associated lipoprotein QseG [Mixta theicola]GLR10438.1 membrane protein [Mixta theicola]
MTIFTFSAAQRFGRRLLLLPALLVVACQQPIHSVLPRQAATPPEPKINIVDYLAVDCARVWHIDDGNSIKNPLYWMRAIDCAARLSPVQARAEAHGWPATNWQNSFKQGILLDNGNVTPVERRQYVEQLDSFSVAYPGSVRPLLQLWRNNQAAQLDLSESRTRYHHLQQTSDSQLDALRQKQLSLSRELKETRRKLETLTDIERQLSSRKSPDVSDNSHSDESGAGAASAPSGENSHEKEAQ